MINKQLIFIEMDMRLVWLVDFFWKKIYDVKVEF